MGFFYAVIGAFVGLLGQLWHRIESGDWLPWWFVPLAVLTWPYLIVKLFFETRD